LRLLECTSYNRAASGGLSNEILKMAHRDFNGLAPVWNFVRTSDDPLILSLETTTRAGSLALMRGSRSLSARAGDAQVSHSTDLLENIRAVLMQAGHTLNDVDLFAVANGPGSFTGLRIGVATAKAFAATLSRPVIGVPTLYAVALSAGPSSCTLAMIPAGRGEVFGQLLAVSTGGVAQPLNDPVHLPPKNLLAGLSARRELTLAGEAVKLYMDEISAYARLQGISLDSESGPKAGSTVEKSLNTWMLVPEIENLAFTIAVEASRLFKSGETGNPEELRAIYVRPSDAELNEQCPEQNQPAG
jgi:tRNA threonylcarbamoyladenosine biosynthesis protein TsaB